MSNKATTVLHIRLNLHAFNPDFKHGQAPERCWHEPNNPSTSCKHGGTWQVEVLLLPRALRGRVEGRRRCGAGREGRRWRGGRGGCCGRGVAARVWLVGDRDVVLQEKKKQNQGRGHSSEREQSRKRPHPSIVGPWILPKSRLPHPPHQVLSALEGTVSGVKFLSTVWTQSERLPRNASHVGDSHAPCASLILERATPRCPECSSSHPNTSPPECLLENQQPGSSRASVREALSILARNAAGTGTASPARNLL